MERGEYVQNYVVTLVMMIIVALVLLGIHLVVAGIVGDVVMVLQVC